MKKTPNIFTLASLMNSVKTNSALIGENYIPARPIGFWPIGYRLRAAWLVWTGKADAVIWPGGQ